MKFSFYHASEHKLIDETALDKIRALQQPGRPNILHRVITRYLEHSPQLLKQLHEAIVAAQPESIYITAHSLKSASANLGATELAAFCADLEQMGREQSLERADELLAIIERKHNAVIHDLSARLKEKAHETSKKRKS